VAAVFGIILGVVLVGLGAIMISNYQSWGTQIVEKTVPNFLRTADVDSNRKALGYSYFLGGIVFVVISIVAVAK
jgi:FAD synthase